MKKTVAVNAANFKSEVLDATEPVLVGFWAEWCETCRLLVPVLEEIADEHGGWVKIAKVNVDENPALAGRHHVHSIPTLIYYYNGLIHDQLVGVANKTTISTRLESLVTKR